VTGDVGLRDAETQSDVKREETKQEAQRHRERGRKLLDRG